MKRIIVMIMIPVMLLGLFSCKRADHESAAPDDEYVSLVPGGGEEKIPESSEEPEKEAAKESEKEPEKEAAKETEKEPERKAENEVEKEDEKYFDEIVRTYDAADYKDFWAQLEETRRQLNHSRVVFSGWTFSRLMEEMGEGGIVVAGYLTGTQEEHRYYNPDSLYPYYILSNFVVTDLYQGNEKASQIRIREEYRLFDADGMTQVLTIYDGDHFLVPEQQVLLFLKKNDGGETYSRVFHPIYLTEDYRNYDDDSLSSLLDYYRGTESAYPENSVSAEPEESDAYYYEAEDGSGNIIRIPIESADRYGKTVRWTEREITNERLLEEMKEHILVRAASEYGIALWPTQHINYTENSFTTGHRDLGLEKCWKETLQS